MDKSQYKYKKILSPSEFGFLQYFMLPQKDQFDYVYRPGDDSFLMLSVLKQQLPSFPKNSTICQIGSGSGILSAHVSKWLQQANNQPCLHIATDINIDACILSEKYYDYYKLNVIQVCTSLLKGCRIYPEIIICNPPYVLTDQSQRQTELKYLQQKLADVRDKKEVKRAPNKNLIAYSYMGGPDGLEITRQLINFLKWETKLYIIVMGQQGLQILKQQVQTGKVLSKNIKATFQPLQFYKKYNEQLFVVLITTKLI